MNSPLKLRLCRAVCKTVVGAESFTVPGTHTIHPHPRDLTLLRKCKKRPKKSMAAWLYVCVRGWVCVWGLGPGCWKMQQCVPQHHLQSLGSGYNLLGVGGRGGGREGAASLLTPQPVSFWIDCRQYHQYLLLPSKSGEKTTRYFFSQKPRNFFQRRV